VQTLKRPAQCNSLLFSNKRKISMLTAISASFIIENMEVKKYKIKT
jgi:hypothetical protein